MSAVQHVAPNELVAQLQSAHSANAAAARPAAVEREPSAVTVDSAATHAALDRLAPSAVSQPAGLVDVEDEPDDHDYDELDLTRTARLRPDYPAQPSRPAPVTIVTLRARCAIERPPRA
jgi:hypothetical protein